MSLPRSAAPAAVFIGQIMLALCVAARLAAADGDPDVLYGQRANMASARQALDIWQARLDKDPRDFASAWKVARATYWIGKHESGDQGRRTFERGVAAGRQAAEIRDDRPEGHFWMAANMGALAESYGLRQGLKYRGTIKDAVEKVLRIDPAFQSGSAYSALGRWYHMVPGLFGGSEARSEDLLRKALTFGGDDILARSFLADTLFERDKDIEAIGELRKIIAATPSADFGPEDREVQARAAAELARRTARTR